MSLAAFDNADVPPPDLPVEPAGDVPLAVRRHPLVAHVASQLHGISGAAQQQEPLPIVIALSGGADSVALLLTLLALRHRGSVQPMAAHIHHHLRDSADEDAAFVRRLCERFSVPLSVRDVYPDRSRGNLAAGARHLRYAALVEVAREYNAAWIAAAHHAGDQLETMLMALCRGAGLDGLSGMSARTDLTNDITLIRPLLHRRSQELRAFCTLGGITWREDPTNANVEYARARLRRDVTPVLEALWPNAAVRASTAADLLQAGREALALVVEQTFGGEQQQQWNRAMLAPLSPAIIAAGLRRAAIHLASESADALGYDTTMEAARLIACDDRRRKTLAWPGRLKLTITATTVSICRAS